MYLKKFNNDIALQIGLKIIELSKKNHQIIGFSIGRLNHTVVSYMMDGMTKDKVDWLRRKVNSSKRFEMSTSDIHKKFHLEPKMFYEKYGLDKKDYVAVAGAVPIFTKESGLIAVIAVTGLKPDEDHQLIIDAIDAYKKEVNYEI